MWAIADAASTSAARATGTPSVAMARSAVPATPTTSTRPFDSTVHVVDRSRSAVHSSVSVVHSGAGRGSGTSTSLGGRGGGESTRSA